MIFLYLILGGIGAYLLLTLFLSFVVQKIPRRPVKAYPDWGLVTDTRIPAPGKGFLEVWRIEPEESSRGIVVMAHGWGRNRDRMVSRARVFGGMGFTSILLSARDHGASSPRFLMNAFRFGEDISAVLDWVGEPVLLYGHSAGAAGAVIAASQNPGRVKALFLEACYARTKEALLSLYRNFNPLFGLCFAPMVVLWMDVYYRFKLDSVSPVRMAPYIDVPVLIIHGERDEKFPLEYAWRLRDSFPPGRGELFVAKGAGHSDSSQAPGYQTALQAFVGRHIIPSAMTRG